MIGRCQTETAGGANRRKCQSGQGLQSVCGIARPLCENLINALQTVGKPTRKMAIVQSRAL